MNDKPLKVAVLGCGSVGSQVVRLLLEQSGDLAARVGAPLELAGVAVRRLDAPREVDVPDGLLTTDALGLATRDDVDLVVEVIGGIDLARDLILGALEAGAIPVIRPLTHSLAGDTVVRVAGIVNGTTNYILSAMNDTGASYEDALADASALGYAEADPTADVEGFDAAAKAAILSSLAFHTRITAADVYREGIAGLGAADIAFAKRMGYVVKLLAIAERVDGAVAVRVHPTMVPNHHPLASVRDSYNAVFVEGGAVGSLMFYGRGAGGRPTASAVLGDLIDAAVNLRQGTHGPMGTFTKARVRPIDETSAEYYLPLEVIDRPGVLHAVTGAFAKHDVSIRSMEQEGHADDAQLVFITHEAREADVQATLRDLRDLEVVKRVGGLLRVVGA